MEQKKDEAVRIAYPAGSRLLVYERLLDVLYQQNKISKETYKRSIEHVDRVIDKKTKQ